MRLRTVLSVAFLGLAVWGVLRAQKPFKEWPAIEYDDFPLPGDYQDKHEWTRARMRYTDFYGYPDVMLFSGARSWPGYWTMDFPRSDRHLLEGVRRLTRIDTKSVEQVVTFDGSDDVYNWPMLYAVEVGHWKLKDAEAAQLRDFLQRGGFLMVDDFHGEVPYHQVFNEWQMFLNGMRKVFPERPIEDIIEDIPSSDPIFHTLWDLDERFQVPGSANYFETHLTYEAGETGKVPHWRCIRDDKGRVMVAICHNMDLGDGWENSDDPKYSEKWSNLAYRVGINYFMYDLTH
jgi:hypothetical protein